MPVLAATRVALLAIAIACLLPSGSAAAARGVTYGGVSSEDEPIVLVLSRDGKTIKRVVMQVNATCAGAQGSVRAFVNRRAEVKVRASGRFAGALEISGRLPDGNAAQGAITLRGTVSGRKLSGSASYGADVLDAAGAVVDSCEQAVTLKARSARGRIYGGATSSGGPVVITLGRALEIGENSIGLARKVREFRIGWAAPCSTGEMLSLGDTLTDFPIRAGRFGDDWTWTPANGDTFDYSLHGTIKRTSVSGTFSVKWSGDSPAGPDTTCDTGALTYRASSG